MLLRGEKLHMDYLHLIGKMSKNLQPLAVGSFGYVYCVNYVFLEEDRKVVVKKLRGESSEAESRFLLERRELFQHLRPEHLSFATVWRSCLI